MKTTIALIAAFALGACDTCVARSEHYLGPASHCEHSSDNTVVCVVGNVHLICYTSRDGDMISCIGASAERGQ